MESESGGGLYKPELIEAIVREVTASLLRRLKLKYEKLEIEAEEQKEVVLREVIPEFREVSVKQLFQKPTREDAPRIVNAKVSLDAMEFIIRFIKVLRKSKAEATLSDLVRYGLCLVISYIIGDQESFGSTLRELDYIREKIASWSNLAYRQGKTDSEARFYQVLPSKTGVLPTSGFTTRNQTENRDDRREENRGEDSSEENDEYREARRLAREALLRAREEGLSEAVYRQLLEAKERLEKFKSKAVAQFFLREIERYIEMGRNVYGYR